MSWGEDLRRQILADQRESARLRGALSTDTDAIPNATRSRQRTDGGRRRIVTARAA